MTDIRTRRLADALREANFLTVKPLTYEQTADVLLSLPGIAIVELGLGRWPSMSDLRARLVEELAGCAVVQDSTEAGQIVDALLSTPGVAIVELPEPERASEEVGSFLSRDGTAVNRYGDYYGQTPDEMRSHAAALLAAADAAEEKVSDG